MCAQENMTNGNPCGFGGMRENGACTGEAGNGASLRCNCNTKALMIVDIFWYDDTINAAFVSASVLGNAY